MTITIELAPELHAELARQAAARGVGVDAYAASLVENAAGCAADRSQPSTPSCDVVEAIETLKGFGRTHGLSLCGMTIRELRDAARP